MKLGTLLNEVKDSETVDRQSRRVESIRSVCSVCRCWFPQKSNVRTRAYAEAEASATQWLLTSCEQMVIYKRLVRPGTDSYRLLFATHRHDARIYLALPFSSFVTSSHLPALIGSSSLSLASHVSWSRLVSSPSPTRWLSLRPSNAMLYSSRTS